MLFFLSSFHPCTIIIIIIIPSSMLVISQFITYVCKSTIAFCYKTYFEISASRIGFLSSSSSCTQLLITVFKSVVSLLLSCGCCFTKMSIHAFTSGRIQVNATYLKTPPQNYLYILSSALVVLVKNQSSFCGCHNV